MNLWMQDCDCNDSKSEYNFNAQLVNSRTRFRNQVSETNDLSWQLQVWMLHTSSEKVVAKFADQIFSSNKLLKENFWKAGKFSCSFFLAWDNALSRFWRLARPAVCTYTVIAGRSPGDNEQGMPTCVPERLEMRALFCACFPPRCWSDANCMPREATPGCGSMNVQLLHHIVLSSNSHLHKQDTTLLIAQQWVEYLAYG